MRKHRKFSLSTQINLIFTLITVVTSILFVLIFNQTFDVLVTDQANKHYKDYHKALVKELEKDDLPIFSEYYDYYVYKPNEYHLLYESKKELKQEFQTFLNIYLTNSNYFDKTNIDTYLYKNKEFLVEKIRIVNKDYYLVTSNSGLYKEELNEPISGIVMIGFVAIIILGNAIILLWSSVTVERIKKLELEVSELTNKSYRKRVSIDGNDEISDLATTIDKMRLEILKNDEVKQEMLQNLSHDIKTPIAVIKSYSEAIKDGYTSIDDLNIIIEQTNVLDLKVKKLLQWNKLEYIDDKKEFYPVNMKEVIETVANNFKFKSEKIKFDLNLDNSYLIGLEEHFYTLVSNIVENALRYAKTTIKITLKNKKLTIYNDGEHIHEKFLNTDFKPYEKGHLGEFGLGLTIVQKIITNFNLSLKIENLEKGVSFTIEPL